MFQTNSDTFIEQVNPLDDLIQQEKSNLTQISDAIRGFIYLDDFHSNFLFFSKLNSTKKLVGYLSLRSYENPEVYGVSYLVHPDFENRGIATSLVKSAIDFAKNDLSIERLSARVNSGTTSEHIIQKLGFNYKSGFKNNFVYSLLIDH